MLLYRNRRRKMRLWSIHPKYLDSKGLVAEWKEGLQGIAALKRSIIEPDNRRIMFINHPQLIRFKQTGNPVEYLNLFLWFVFKESDRRGYNFNYGLLDEISDNLSSDGFDKIPVTYGQIVYELKLLGYKYVYERKKPPSRNFSPDVGNILLHPVFKLEAGDIESWEKQRKEVTEYPLDTGNMKIIGG